MTRGGRAALVLAAFVLAALAVAPVGGPAAAAGLRTAASVSVRVLSMSPAAPRISSTPQRLTVQLLLTNRTATRLKNVSVTGNRADPLVTLADVNAAVAGSGAGLVSETDDFASKPKIDVTLQPDVPTPVTFVTDMDIPTDADICLCTNGVYPLQLTARQDVDGVARELGTATTYLSSFVQQPAPVRVAWIWPIVDRPHRLDSETVFTDDELADLVSPGGRLWRALATVAAVRPSTPMTLLLDPELLDELEVMATKTYFVPEGTGQVKGVGQQPAAEWLDRLATLLEQRKALSVKLTAYADPDVQTLAEEHLPWQSTLPVAMQANVDAALAGRPAEYDLVWPVQGALGARALQRLAVDGVRTAVLGSGAVTPTDPAASIPAPAAALRSSTVTAVLTSPAVQRTVSAVVTGGDAGLAQLPQLMAQIAVRAAQEIDTEHDLVLTPPRYVDPDPQAAATAIDDTTAATFARPLTLADATSPGRVPTAARRLASVPRSAAALPAAVTTSARAVGQSVRTIGSMLATDTSAAAQITARLSVGVQRTESTYWTLQRSVGGRLAEQLRRQAGALTSGVRIVQPKSGSYTLGSANSPLPVTVENDLDYPVSVRLDVSTVNRLPGLTADPVTAVVRPRSKRILRVPTTIARSGRIRIRAELTAPNGQSLSSTALSVHSTVLGALGIVITVVSGGVLVLALLVRVIRRWRRRGAPRPAAQAALVP